MEELPFVGGGVGGLVGLGGLTLRGQGIGLGLELK